MEFKEISDLWKNAPDRPGSLEVVNRLLLEEVTSQKIRSGLVEGKLSTFIELGLDIIWLGFLGRFLGEHLEMTQFMVPAIILLLGTVFSLGLVSYRLWLFYSAHHEDAIRDAQLKVARLQYLEELEIKLLWIMIPLYTVPFLIVLAKGFLDLDLYQWSGFLWQISAGSIVVAAIMVVILRRNPSKKLKEARDFLDELENMV
ncbi:hypothetical protein [Echinicola vietnamensis]|uniref:Uncharacterized protein n=1 Tax=Echinicola vietnamensis (strain DSM 17526 / LMG 23754 / KMM 6221) TaxID=926556 RepID=L0FXV9_ECHVK|nr:hypothetical protein [Echinicola vietnamensis]AGA77576.1 hypothetical protein Echvi_1305 [Echinicola vietnamensis DSM 17526]